MSDLMLADLIVAVHVAYMAFVVMGQALVLIGVWRGWRWIRNPWFRTIHLLAILIVAGESVLNVPCPLTTWEAELRRRAGQSVGGGSFVGNLLHELLFFDLPDWVFNVSYVAFALIVAATFWWAPPRWKRARSGSH